MGRVEGNVSETTQADKADKPEDKDRSEND